MCGAEGECRDADCKPGSSSPSQHLAGNGFAEEEFLADGTNEDYRNQAPEVVRHGQGYLHHCLRKLHASGQDGDAHGSQYGCCGSKQGWPPPDGCGIQRRSEADVVQA